MIAYFYSRSQVLESTWPKPGRIHDFRIKVVDIITGRVHLTATLKYEDEEDLEQQLSDFRRRYDRKYPRKAARSSIVRSER